MHFVVFAITFVLSSYLSFTNLLATHILAVLPHEQTESNAGITQAYSAVAQKLVTIESKSKYSSIPDILLRNSEYQQASVVESIDPATAGATALDALVNIYCSYQTGQYTKTTTGTGFFIDTNGIILTNAHVAQFLLLEGIAGDAHCYIRTGNPATAQYEAELLYISPAWVREHADLINQTAPKGTGERDYALLYVTSGIDGKPVPAQFAALPFDVRPLTLDTVGTEVFATGYPAEAMIEQGIDTPLIPKQATTTIGEVMTFGSQLVDLFTIRGSVIGEHGSSGGPIVDSKAKAIGIISTKGDDTQFGAGSLRAITLSYIDRTIKEETGFTLRQNLGGNLPYRAALFKKTIVPFLQNTLKQEL